MKRKSEYKIDDSNLRKKRMGKISSDRQYTNEIQNLKHLGQFPNNSSDVQTVNRKQNYEYSNQENFQMNFPKFPLSRKDSKSRITIERDLHKNNLNNINEKNFSSNLISDAKLEIEDEDEFTHIASNKKKLISKIKENMDNKFKKFKYFDIGEDEEASGNKTPIGIFNLNIKENQKSELNQSSHNFQFNINNSKYLTPNLTIHKINSDLNTQNKLSNPQSVFTFKGETISNTNSKNVTITMSSIKKSSGTQNNFTSLNNSLSNLVSNYYPKKKNLLSSNIFTNQRKDSNSKNFEIDGTSYSEIEGDKNRDDVLYDLDEFLENNDLNDILKEENNLDFSDNGIENNCKISKNNSKNFFPFPLNVFISHEKLNPIQENSFDLLFHSDSNSVITAPTGSGKTVLFEMAISRLVGENFDRNSKKFFNKNFKIVYLAPIKSLCQEKFFDWKVKFSQTPFDLSVVEATGDSDYINITQLINSNIILSTPERWDVITRKWKDYPNVISSISLFLIDEIHLLNEEQRGATLEAIIARMKLLSNLPQFENCFIKNFRIIAISATIPNIEELAEFLNVDIKTSLKNFGEEYRPVKIEKLVFGYNMAKNEYLFEKYLNYRLADSISKYSDNRPSLVFCQTQKGTINAAMQLLTDIGRLNMNLNDKSEARFNLSLQIRDKQLANLVKNGIAFHNAGLCVEDRQLVEEYFKKGIIKIICTTSTLAQGVNLPARLVIIKSTYCYRGPKIGYNEYNKMEIDQMIGRAGRPQYDNKGIAIIMTEKQNVDKYIDMTSSSVYIESHLRNYIIEHINAEITLGTIIDINSAVNWLKNTFMYVRMKNNPEKYGLKKQINTNMVTLIDNHLEKICMKMFNDLKENELISLEEFNETDKCEKSEICKTNQNSNKTLDKNNGCINKTFKARPKSLGKKMSKNYVYFDTLKIINKITHNTDEAILETLSNSHEFSKYNSKMEDRKTLNNFNKEEFSIKYKIKGPIDTANKKAFILLQAALGGLNIDQWELRRQQNEIVTASVRILNCIKEYFKMKNDARGYINTLILKKSLIQRMWHDNDSIMKQLPKIGDKLAKNFVKAGINSFEKLINENPRRLEAICGKNTPFGNILIDIVKSIPLMEFKYEILKNFKNTMKISMVVNLPWKKFIHQEDFDPYTNYHIVIVEISTNQIIFKKKIKPNAYNKNIFLNVPNVNRERFPLNVHLICDKFIGLDKIISIANSEDQKGTVNNFNSSGQMTLFQLYGEKIKNPSNSSNNLNKSLNPPISNEKDKKSSTNTNIQSIPETEITVDLDNQIEKIINDLDDQIKSKEKNEISDTKSIDNFVKNKNNQRKEKVQRKNKGSNQNSLNENNSSNVIREKSNLKNLLNNLKSYESTNRKNENNSSEENYSNINNSFDKENSSSNQIIQKLENTELTKFNDKTPPRNKNKKLGYIHNFEKNNTTACTDPATTIVKNKEFDLDFLDNYEFNPNDETSIKVNKSTGINLPDIINLKSNQNPTQNLLTQNTRFKLNFDDLL